MSTNSDGDADPDWDEYDIDGDGDFDIDDIQNPLFDEDGDGRPKPAERDDQDSDNDTGQPDSRDPTDGREIPDGEKWLVEAVWDVDSLKDHVRRDPNFKIPKESHNMTYQEPQDSYRRLGGTG